MNRSNPLQGKRVLITRAQEQSGPLARLLEEQGAVPVFAPLIGLATPDDPEPARDAAANASAYAWIVFTSVNGVRAFFDLRKAARELRAGAERYAAVGAATAAALQERHIEPQIVPAQFVSDDLAPPLLAATSPGDRILIFGAQEMRDALPELLREQGRAVDVVAGYKTVAVHDDGLETKARSCDILTFASASAVRAFVDGVSSTAAVCAGKTVACIGPVTASQAQQSGMRVDVVAQIFTAQGLCDALRQHLA